MDDDEKTAILPSYQQPGGTLSTRDYLERRCPNCNAEMQPIEDDAEHLRCPQCLTIKKFQRIFVAGDVIRNYKIERILGRGGMCDLFLCSDLNAPGSFYALKRLRETDDEDSEKRFERESRLILLLNHENIVRIYDQWRDENGMFILMEYVDGNDLETLRRDYLFTEEFALGVVLCLTVALQYAWDEIRLLHRDIKPSNVMLSTDGIIKLLDFGIAKSLDSSQAGTTITITNFGMGTPEYMSPEQFRNMKEIDCTSDIFSLGATLYFLLAGKPPYQGSSPTTVYANILRDNRTPIREIRNDISHPCEQLIEDMLNKDPRKRPRSWRQLKVDLERVQSGRMPIPK